MSVRVQVRVSTCGKPSVTLAAIHGYSCPQSQPDWQASETPPVSASPVLGFQALTAFYEDAGHLNPGPSA